METNILIIINILITVGLVIFTMLTGAARKIEHKELFNGLSKETTTKKTQEYISEIYNDLDEIKKGRSWMIAKIEGIITSQLIELRRHINPVTGISIGSNKPSDIKKNPTKKKAVKRKPTIKKKVAKKKKPTS